MCLSRQDKEIQFFIELSKNPFSNTFDTVHKSGILLSFPPTVSYQTPTRKITINL